MTPEQQFVNELARISQETEAVLQEIQQCAQKYQEAVNKIEQIGNKAKSDLIELLKTIPNPDELVTDVSGMIPIHLPGTYELGQLVAAHAETTKEAQE